MLVTVGFSMLFCSILLIIISLVFIVIWKIPSLIDELSGRKAKRQIERMKKLNIVTSSLDVSDTAEFYKSLNYDNFSTVQNNTSSINKMVDDPYNAVNMKTRDISKRVTIPNNPADDIATEMFSDMPERLNIKIIEEQSSLR